MDLQAAGATEVEGDKPLHQARCGVQVVSGRSRGAAKPSARAREKP